MTTGLFFLAACCLGAGPLRAAEPVPGMPAMAAAMGPAVASPSAAAQSPAPAVQAAGAAPLSAAASAASATADSLKTLAESPDMHKPIFDGSGLIVGGQPGVKGEPVGPRPGEGKPAANPPPDTGAPQDAPPPPKPDTPAFFDTNTAGFASAGAVLGALLGLGVSMIFGFGILGIAVGAVIGAAAITAIWKAGGYKK